MRARIGISLMFGAGIAALVFALTATASSLPTEPPATSGPCLSVTVTPHVVNAGGVVTARTGPGTGGCTQSQLQWNWFVNGVKSTTCGTSTTSCAITATRPTNGYRPICAVGTGTSPGIQACDYVDVVSSRVYTVSGRLTAHSPFIKRLAKDTPSLANVADATVEAVDKDGDSTTVKTTANGSYSLSLPRGRYDILVHPDAGTGYLPATTPASRTVVVSGDVGHVNFALGRVIHLQGKSQEDGFATGHGIEMSLELLRHGRRVGLFSRFVCSPVVCSGRGLIEGVPEHPWLRIHWPPSGKRDHGLGAVTSERIVSDDRGEPNYPSEENQYEGTILVHVGPWLGGGHDNPFRSPSR